MTRNRYPDPNPKRKAGRIGLWKPEFIEQARFLTSKMGATDRDLADFFKISINTIDLWKVKKPAFMKAIQEGKADSNQRVEKAFYQRAIGYEHPDTVVLTNRIKIEHKDDEGKTIRVEERTEPLLVPTMKHYPPDGYSCLKWLTIRDKQNWAEITNLNIQQTTTLELKADFSNLSFEQLEMLKVLSIDKYNQNKPKMLKAV